MWCGVGWGGGSSGGEGWGEKRERGWGEGMGGGDGGSWLHPACDRDDFIIWRELGPSQVTQPQHDTFFFLVSSILSPLQSDFFCHLFFLYFTYGPLPFLPALYTIV